MRSGVFGPASNARAKLRALVPATDDDIPPRCLVPRTPSRRVPAGCRGLTCCAGCSSDIPNAACTKQVTPSIRITHPFHPQCGQEIELVIRRPHWGEDRVFYRSVHGHISSLPARWTSLVPADPVVTVGGERAQFRMHDLIELAGIVSRLRT